MNGRRNTIQRRLVFDAVKELDIHATAEQVYEHIAKTHSSISKATVYRNLSGMAEAGELLNIGSISGAAHYDHNCHDHYHFICEKCGKVFDVDYFFPEINGRVSKMADFTIKGHSLIYHGLCPFCK